ncbi:MAG: glycosyltransferase [Syntrophobacter sp.]
MTDQGLMDLLHDRNVLFITPSDVDYIRNKQEINLLRKASKSLEVIAPRNGHAVDPTGLKRIMQINLRAILEKTDHFDAVFVGGVPQLIVPFIRFPLRKKTLIVDFFFSLYDTFVEDRQLLSEKNPFSKILKWLDRYTLTRADYVIADTNEHAKHFREICGGSAEKMGVVHLEADTEIYYPREMERPPELKDKFIVFFFGAMNPLQGVDVILDAAQLIEERRHITFMMIGPREKLNDPDQFSRLTNVKFAGRWLPQTEVADYIAMADVCLAGHFNAAVPKAGRVIPGKAYSYLAMDKPTILGDNPANREVFSDGSRNVQFVPMGDPRALADCILRMAAQQIGN